MSTTRRGSSMFRYRFALVAVAVVVVVWFFGPSSVLQRETVSGSGNESADGPAASRQSTATGVPPTGRRGDGGHGLALRPPVAVEDEGLIDGHAAEQSAFAPAPEMYGEKETVRSRDVAGPDRRVHERVRLVRADFKYPLLRVEERYREEWHEGRVRPLLERRTVMVAGHVLVSGRDAEALSKAGHQVMAEVAPGAGIWRVAIAADDPDDLPGALAAIRGQGLAAEPDYLVFAGQRIPNDPLFSTLWGMRNTGQTGGTGGADIKATQAWVHATGNDAVTVAVIDSGVDYGHADLAPNIWSHPGETVDGVDSDGNGYVDDVRGWNFYANSNNPMDDHFHGTHVAGTIGARGDNLTGVAGVAWHLRLMPLKFLSAGGGGATSDAIAAIRYSADNGARISCNSWGGGGYSRFLEDAIRHAASHDSLFVAAAGNNAGNNELQPMYPASYDLPNVISVAATDHSDELAWFSNYGPRLVHIAAPGVGIHSTFPRSVTQMMTAYGLPAEYARISGTSMAAPHVAGAAALLLGTSPQLSALQMKNLILARADFVPSLTGFVASSARLNVDNLVNPGWVPPPADPRIVSLQWNEAAGFSNNDGTAAPGERLDIRVRLVNRGGLAAEGLQFNPSLISGPGTLVPAAGAPPSSLAAYDGFDGVIASLQVDPAATDMQELVFRLQLGWQGGVPVTSELVIQVVRFTPPQATAEVDWSVGEMIQGASPNKVLVVSPSAWRLMEFDTESARMSRHADLDPGGLQLDPLERRTGGIAVHHDRSRVYVALTGTRRIQEFLLPELVAVKTLEVDHEPFSLAVDARGRLFTTEAETFGPLREVNLNTGRTVGTYWLDAMGRRIVREALLKTNDAGTRLYLGETGVRVVGGPGFIYEWDVSGVTPAVTRRHPNVTVFLEDFAIDEVHGNVLTMHGGIYGVQVTSMATGQYGTVWPLQSPYGVAIDLPPGSPRLFAGSGGTYPGLIRRFSRSTGADNGALIVRPGDSGSTLLRRQLVATANERVLYASYQLTLPNAGIDGLRYFLTLAGSSQLDATLPPPQVIPARPVLARVEFSDLVGNGDSYPNPGETIELAPSWRNVGQAATAAGNLSLVALTPGVEIEPPAGWSLPAIAGNATVDLSPLTMTLPSLLADGSTVDFEFRMSLNDGSSYVFPHRLQVRAAGPPAGTNPFARTGLQFSGVEAHPTRNEVYLVDSKRFRVIALDTTYGMIRKVAAIPMERRVSDGIPLRLGGPAVSVDGSLLAIAGNETRMIHVLSLPGLEPVANLPTGFRPTHVAFDAAGRLHATGAGAAAGGTLEAMMMNARDGSGVVRYGSNSATSPLGASADGTLIGRREGSSLRIYSVTGAQPVLQVTIPLPGTYLADFKIDVARNRVLLVTGNGKVSVRSLATGTETASWPLNTTSGGIAVNLLPNGEVAAASDWLYGGGIRRYSAEGTVLADTVVTNASDYQGGHAGVILADGVVSTPNRRVIFVAALRGSELNRDDNDYTVGMIGAAVDLTEPAQAGILLTSLAVSDPTPANGNGFAEPGERLVLVPNLRNTSFGMLRNVMLRLESTNPQVTLASPLTVSLAAVNLGVNFTTPTSGLGVQLGSSLADGEPLGLSLRITHEAGSTSIPLGLYATRTVRGNAELGFTPGVLLSDPLRNRIYLTDQTNNRVLALDTQTGTVVAAGELAGTVAGGGLALSADGSRLAVALSGSSRIQLLSSETLATEDVVHVGFNPVSVAFGANGRVYATTDQTWSRLREIDPSTGAGAELGTIDYYRNSALLADAAHSQVHVYPAELSGIYLPVDAYSTTDATPTGRAASSAVHATGAMRGLLLDESLNRFYVACGGTNGLRVVDTIGGSTGAIWPLPGVHAAGCAFVPGSSFVYGMAGSERSSVRRFDRNSGRVLAEFGMAIQGVTGFFYPVDSGIAVTPNGRVLFLTMNQTTKALSTRFYASLIGHGSLSTAVPQVRARVNLGVDRTVRLFSPLALGLETSHAGAVVQWSKKSGPGSAVFSSNGTSASVNFSQPGRYRIEARITTSQTTAVDGIWVDVVENPPLVNLTALASVGIAHPSVRNGFVLTREGTNEDAVTVQLIRGGTATPGIDFQPLPTSVTIPAGVRRVEVPLVLMPAAALRTVTLTLGQSVAYEPGPSQSASVRIVSPTIEEWLAWLGEAAAGRDSTPGGDVDGDGLANRMEYLLGSDPLAPDIGNPLRVISSGAVLAFEYRRATNFTGPGLVLEFSADCRDWSPLWQGNPATVETGRIDHNDGRTTIKFRLSDSARLLSRGFLRLSAVGSE